MMAAAKTASSAAPESERAAGIEEASSISNSRLTYLAMAFAGPRDGAILDSAARVKVPGNCALALYTTRDGATRWSGPLVFGDGAPCLDNLVSGQESLSVTSAGAWWVAIGNKLYTGTLAGPAGKDVSLPGGAQACSVTASGATVYVAIEPKGSCWTPTGLLRSTDSGTTWSKVRSLPVALVGSPTVAAVVLPTADSVVAIGWPPVGSPPKMLRWRGSLAVAQQTGDGAWYAGILPCRAAPGKTTVWTNGLVTSSGKRFVAACLGPAEVGTTGIEIVTSSDGGHKWSERCGFSLASFGNTLNTCPDYGSPTGIAIAPDGELVMSDDNVGLLASLDDGATWRTVVASPFGGAPFIDLSSTGGVLWALAFGPGPVTAGAWLAHSTNGESWHRAKLPTT
jgi:pyrimidine deaminase RibD-like protein